MTVATIVLLEHEVPMDESDQLLKSVFRQPLECVVICVVLEAEAATRCRVAVLESPLPA